MRVESEAPETAAGWTRHTYSVERVMLGTSWLGGVRVIRVRVDRQLRRNPGHVADVVRRWGERQWRRLGDAWWPVGEFEAGISHDHSELFMRNEAAIRVDRRAIRVDAAFRRWLALGPTTFDTKAQLIDIAIPDGDQSEGGAT